MRSRPGTNARQQQLSQEHQKLLGLPADFDGHIPQTAAGPGDFENALKKLQRLVDAAEKSERDSPARFDKNNVLRNQIVVERDQLVRVFFQGQLPLEFAQGLERLQRSLNKTQKQHDQIQAGLDEAIRTRANGAMPLKFLVEHAGKHLGREYCVKWAVESILTHLLRHHQALCYSAFNRWITRHLEGKAGDMAEADLVHHYIRGFRILAAVAQRHFLRARFRLWWKRWHDTVRQMRALFDEDYIAHKERYGQVSESYGQASAHEKKQITPPIRWMSGHAQKGFKRIQRLARAALARWDVQRRREQRMRDDEGKLRVMVHAISFERSAAAAVIEHQSRVRAELRAYRYLGLDFEYYTDKVCTLLHHALLNTIH
jgi:hypothetical protein